MNDRNMPRQNTANRSAQNRNNALRDVYETGFMVDDAVLYLDTHGYDPQAMEYYRYAKQANQRAVADFENNYGPLMYTNVNADTWAWIDNPWPWEGDR